MAQSSITLKEEIVAEFQAEFEKIQARAQENQQLIEQTQLEVNRLRDRNVAIGAQLSRVESSFDTVPRADIKATYDDALDAKTRLLTMYGPVAASTPASNQSFKPLASNTFSPTT